QEGPQLLRRGLVVPHPPSQLRPPFPRIFEGHRQPKTMRRLQVPQHHTLVLDDFLEHALVLVVAAGAVHCDAPPAAWPQVQLPHRIRESFGPPPALQPRRVSKRVIGRRARSFEDAHIYDLLVLHLRGSYWRYT